MTFKTNSIITESNDLSKFGKEFQLKLLALLIKDRGFSLNIIPYIKDVYFSDVYLKTIFLSIKDFIEGYYTTPTIDNIKIVLQTNGEKIGPYEKILEKIDSISLEDRDFVMQNTEKFCISKFALTKNDKIVSLLKEGRIGEAKKESYDSFQYSGLEERKIYDMKTDMKKVMTTEKLRTPLPIMFETFNKNSKGGIAGGELCIVVAPSNFGKSNFVVNVARHLNLSKKNVAFFSYEMSADALLIKYFAAILDCNQSEVSSNFSDIEEFLNTQNIANLKIIEDKASNATLSSILSTINYLKAGGFFPDCLIIDGLNQLKLPAGVRAKDDNEKYEILTEGLKDLLKDLGIGGFATWQTNRSGFSSEVNDINSIGKAIEVFQKADQVITFSEPIHLKEKKQCIALLLKNRLGQKEIPLLVNYDPGKVIFAEVEVLNMAVLMSKEVRKTLNETIKKQRDKLNLDK